MNTSVVLALVLDAGRREAQLGATVGDVLEAMTREVVKINREVGDESDAPWQRYRALEKDFGEDRS